MTSTAVKYYESIGQKLLPDKLKPIEIKIKTITKQHQYFKNQKKAVTVTAILPKMYKSSAFD